MVDTGLLLTENGYWGLVSFIDSVSHQGLDKRKIEQVLELAGKRINLESISTQQLNPTQLPDISTVIDKVFQDGNTLDLTYSHDDIELAREIMIRRLYDTPNLADFETLGFNINENITIKAITAYNYITGMDDYIFKSADQEFAQTLTARLGDTHFSTIANGNLFFNALLGESYKSVRGSRQYSDPIGLGNEKLEKFNRTIRPNGLKRIESHYQLI